MRLIDENVLQLNKINLADEGNDYIWVGKRAREVPGVFTGN